MRFRHILLSTALVLQLGDAVANARPVSNVRVQLIICLSNEAGVSPKTVLEVESRVTELFQESAIEVRWINFGPSPMGSLKAGSCKRLSYPDQLLVHWIPQAKTVPIDVLGEAFLDQQDTGVIADLFLDHVRAVESQTNVGFTSLLSYATAHEIAHLLLGANSHSTRGIMQGHFFERDLMAVRRGSLTFERVEELRMHARLLGDLLQPLQINGR